MTIATLPIPNFLRPSAKRTAIAGEEIIVDNFAGGGGASTGIEYALGRSVDIAINHDPKAVDMHRRNHPDTLHLCESVWDVDPVEACAGRPVGVAWFSPDCKHFSRAKGAKPVSKRIRGLAWIAVKWAKLVRPRVIFLENVREFQEWGPLAGDNRPCPKRKGETFKRFVRMLENLGYTVEVKVLNAADFGAPTHRRRLFLIARCDGQPVVWPMPTHGPGCPQPWRTAAECIDWSIPCPSIFERKRPLAEKTLRRIAMGLKKYVFENPNPFIVNVQHGGDDFRGQSIDQPLSTVTAKHGYGVVAPHLVEVANSNWSEGHRPADAPMATVTARPKGGSWAVAAPLLVGAGGPTYSAKPKAVDAPIGTQTGENHTTLVAAFLTKFYGTNVGADLREPMPTVTATGQHLGEVRAFLIKYFGCGCGQECNEPLHTVTTKDRFGLVTVNGQEYQIADIGLRMLTPRELLRAQFGPELAADYILPNTASEAVAKIGNSVAPLCAAAIVRANCPDMIVDKKKRRTA